MLRVPEVNSCMVCWTSQVQLVQASHVKTTCGSGLAKKFRIFVFSDFQGVKVTALAIDENIDRVTNLLVPFREYRISRARVHEIPDCSLDVGSYRFYWVLTAETVIEEVIVVDPPKLPSYFRLRSIASCDTVANTENFIVASNRISQISYIGQATSFDIGTAWIKGTISLEYRMGRLWYLACPHCYLPNDFSSSWGIMCRYCSRDIYTFPRACVTLTIKDDTGSINAIAMGDEAEKLIDIASNLSTECSSY
ncbi:uncharacterized protein [Coffea arabica]|uniref:Uncharacterized protein isoform X4 n=1 Tax=Coffea arabica TaxID=13443 RepID=A0ABM4WIH6_COFAR